MYIPINVLEIDAIRTEQWTDKERAVYDQAEWLKIISGSNVTCCTLLPEI